MSKLTLSTVEYKVVLFSNELSLGLSHLYLYQTQEENLFFNTNFLKVCPKNLNSTFLPWSFNAYSASDVVSAWTRVEGIDCAHLGANCPPPLLTNFLPLIALRISRKRGISRWKKSVCGRMSPSPALLQTELMCPVL